jgi:outer membrane cobalamin receptor
MYSNRFATLILLFCLPITLTPADTELEMKEIVVTATRTEEEVLSAPGHVTVLSEEEISRSGARNMADLLTSQSGIKINDYGAEGSLKSISIRGSALEQVLILVNGVRINDSRQGGVDLAQIPLDNIEKIEIVRGGFSTLYGADAVAGVINIITKKSADGQFKLKVENGAYIPRAAIEVSEGPTETAVDANWLDLVDTQKVGLTFSGSIGEIDLVTTGRFTRAANAFVWNDTEYIDDYRRRINADLLGGGGYVSVTAPLDSGTFGANASLNYQEAGAPRSLTFLSTTTRQKDLNALAQVFLKSDSFVSDLLSLDAKAFYKFSRVKYQDPIDPGDHKLHAFGLDATQELLILDFLSVVYGGNLLVDFVDSNIIDNQNRVSGGLFLEVPLYPMPQLSIIPVVRYDLYSDFPDSLNFKLSTVYVFGDTLAVKLSGGSSYRAPMFNDLYWPDLGWAVGNPDLKPEKGYYGEAGATIAAQRVTLGAFGFARYMVDAIQWVDLDPDPLIYRGQPSNIGEIFYPGFEINGEVNLASNLWLNGAYTFLYSFVLEGASASYSFADDKRAPYTPIHTVDAAIEYRGDKVEAGVSGEYVGTLYTDDANTTEQDAYFVLNATVRYRVSELLTVQAAVDNLLNSTYEVLPGYIAPPISFWLGAELTL